MNNKKQKTSKNNWDKIMGIKLKKIIQSLFEKKPLYDCMVAYPDFKILHMSLSESKINQINLIGGMYIVNQNQVQSDIAKNKKEKELLK